MYFLLPILCLADLQEDLVKVNSLNDLVNSLIELSQDNYIRKIQDQLRLLENEVDRAEMSINKLENTILTLSENHANFNETEASMVQTLVKSLDDYVTNLDKKVRSVDFSTVKSNIPKAIVGQATGDFQAFHSVAKIKQESQKLEATIISNSKFVWLWGLILGSSTTALYISWQIHRAGKASLI